MVVFAVLAANDPAGSSPSPHHINSIIKNSVVTRFDTNSRPSQSGGV